MAALAHANEPRREAGQLLDVLAAPAVAVLFFIGVARFYPHDAFSMGADEGINAMKALLVDRGYRLYGQIWSDQPPLFTHVLRFWFDVFGAQVVHGRLLVLLFTALLIFAVYDLVRLGWNHAAALAAVLVLVSSTHFLPFSVSLMIGIPSLACAALSLWALVRWQHGELPGWLILSGMFMGVSLGIKLFTAFLVPLFAAWLVSVAWRRGRRAPWRPALVWALAVAVPLGAVVVLVGPAHLDQLIAPHVAARAAADFSERRGFLVLMKTVPLDWPIVLLAMLGTWLIITRRCWDLALLPAWAAAALLLLLFHAPVWPHHYLLLSIAAAPAAGVAVAEIFAARRPDRRGATQTATVVRVAAGVALLALVWSIPSRVALFAPPEAVGWESTRATVEAMERFAPLTRLVLTDSPMYAFHAGLASVPDIAVVTAKRKQTGNLSIADVVGGLRRYDPEQVLLTNLLPPATVDALLSAMGERYQLVFTNPAPPYARLFVRGDVVERARRNEDAAAVEPSTSRVQCGGPSAGAGGAAPGASSSRTTIGPKLPIGA